MARTPWSVLGPVLLTLLAPASAQVPPQAVPILKKVGAELVDKLRGEYQAARARLKL